MGIALPQVVTSDRASGAQVIDGSLKFDNSAYLKRTPPSVGNRRTWTWSAWYKSSQRTGTNRYLFAAGYSTTPWYGWIHQLADNSEFQVTYDAGVAAGFKTTPRYRDTGWYHVVWSHDSTQSTNTERTKIYVNGVQVTDFDNTSYPSLNEQGPVNNTVLHELGGKADRDPLLGRLSQVYLIDGQALGPESFGYTDALTNTWRPKKFSGSFTTTSVLDGTTWSSGTVTGTAANGSGSGGWTQAFDGDTSTLVYPSDNNGSTEIVLPKTIAWTSKIRIYAGQNATSGTNIIANGVNLSALHTWPLSGGWQEVTSSLSSPLASLKLLNVGGQASNIRAVEIDDVVIVDGLNNTGVNGFYLPMDGNSPIGEDKSGIVTINDGTVWSDSVSGGIGPYTNGFDGSLSSYMYPRNQDAQGNLVFAGGLPCDAVYCNTYSSSGTEFFTDSASSPTSVNTSSSFAWVSLPADATVLYQIKGTGGAGFDAFAIAAFRKNGTILLDGIKGNSWTPVNFGGSVALDNPQVSGARPILNTDGGGNVARPGVFGSEVGAYYAVTVSNPGSGNKYYLDGVLSANPTLTRGATYTFDQSDSSNSGHPLVFGTTAEGNNYSDGVTTNGTPGSAGAYTKITVPHNAPDTLYYHCSVHSGMGSSTSQITDETKADLYAWKNVLALPLVGNKEDVVASINSAQTNVTVTNNGSVPFPTTESNFYSGSAFFEDMSSDNLTYTNFGSRFEFSGDYTLEAWVYPTSASATDGSIFVEQSGSNYFAFNFDPGTQFNIYNNSSSPSWSPSTNLPPANKWSHIALVRSGSTQTIYVNGNSIATNTESGTHGYASPSVARIGGGASGAMDSYIQDVRIYNGVAKYTSNFVVASTSPDILPDTPSGVSGGSKLAKVTDGAVAFDGSGDYLTIADSTDFDHQSTFTWECFVYLNAYDSSGALIVEQSNGSTFGMQWYISNSGNIQFNRNSSTTLVGPSAGFTLKKWHHLAVSHDGTTIRSFLDGRIIGQATTSTVPDNVSQPLVIGRVSGNTAYEVNGFISNLRFVNGTALYTANFTPPTRELTDVTNTKLLCCQSNTQPGAAAVSPNVSGINDGTVWSSLGTGDADSPYRWEDTFDGNSSTYGAIAPQNSSLNLDLSGLPGGGLSYSSSVVIVVNRNSSAPDLLVNGVAQSITANGSDTTHTISGSGTLTSIGGQLRTAAGSGDMGIKSITVDGVALVDPLTPNGNAAATNFNPFNTDIKTVRGQETGYCTMNPIGKTKTEYFVQDGNLTCGNSSAPSGSSGNRGYVPSTIGFKTGKWYAECVTIRASDGDVDFAIGIFSQNASGYYQNDGTTYNCRPDVKLSSPGGLVQSYGVAWADGDCIGIKVDLDSSTKTIQWLKNGIATGDPVTISTDHEFFFGYGADGGGGGRTYTAKWNFGQKPFKFPPPAGFQPLNAANVKPVKVITRPDQYVGVTTYTGNGSVQSINVGLKPDFVWIKNRDTTDSHVLFDTIRGVERTLYSNLTNNDSYNAGSLTSFDSDGFTLGSYANANQNTSGLVAWTWKAGGKQKHL